MFLMRRHEGILRSATAIATSQEKVLSETPRPSSQIPHLHGHEQESEADDPGPFGNTSVDGEGAEMSQERHEVKHKADDPGDLLGSGCVCFHAESLAEAIPLPAFAKTTSAIDVPCAPRMGAMRKLCIACTRPWPYHRLMLSTDVPQTRTLTLVLSEPDWRALREAEPDAVGWLQLQIRRRLTGSADDTRPEPGPRLPEQEFDDY